MNYISSLLYTISFLFFIFDIFLLIKGKNNVQTFFYFLLLLSTSLWTFCEASIVYFHNQPTLLFFAKLGFLFKIFIPLFLLWFTFSFLNKKTNFLFLIFSLIPIVVILFLITDNHIISNVTFSEKITLHFGDKIWFYYSIFILYFTVSFSLFYKKINQTSGLEYSKLTNSFWGAIIPSILFGLSNNLLPLYNVDSLAWTGPVFLSITLLSLFYATVRFHFMGIKMIFKKNIISLLSIAIVTLSAIWLKKYLYIKNNEHLQIINGFILIISLLILSPIKNAIRIIIEKWLNIPIHDTEKIIDQLNQTQGFQLEAHAVSATAVNALLDIFRFPAGAVFIYHESNSLFLAEYSRGLNFPQIEKLTKDNKDIIDKIFETKSICDFTTAENIPDDFISKMEEEKIDIIIPLYTKDKKLGIIMLTKNNINQQFGKDDLKIIKIIADQTTIALENTILFVKAQKFNENLKIEVNEATSDLREANERLKKIDKSKSDFISIASHQLRTPLTVIKGFTSMLLEGSFGPIPEKQINPLKMTYAANDRLIQLIENLLNISRIETGKLQFKYSVSQLENLVDSVVFELSTSAKLKGLKLSWTKPITPLPPVNIDEEKIRQVVMNLTENAIKYTNEGGVVVNLEQIGNILEFTVSDTGSGIKPDDLPKLFQKYSRGTGMTALKDGNGLGLYVARQMIEIHKGKIWAESDGEGKGSRFIFQLPINNK